MGENKDFVKSIENATYQIIKDTAGNMKKACSVVERDAKINCPVDMGQLRASITNDTMVKVNEIVGCIGSNLTYAPYVHNGTGIYAVDGNGRKTPWAYHVNVGKYAGWHFTKGQKAIPFLERAKIANRSKIAKILGGK